MAVRALNSLALSGLMAYFLVYHDLVHFLLSASMYYNLSFFVPLIACNFFPPAVWTGD